MSTIQKPGFCQEPAHGVVRVVFAGSPAIAIPALQALDRLERSGGPCTIVAVLTNPDRAKGRRGAVSPTGLGEDAARLQAERAALGLPFPVLLKPERLDSPAREAVASLRPDLLVSFAYGALFGPKFLALFPLGGVNVHPSALPTYRGPSPIQAAILNGEAETAVCVQTLAAEMDAGDILAMERLPLSPRETTESLSDQAAQKGAALLESVVQAFAQGTVTGTPQAGEARYCRLVTREDGLLDWNMSAVMIDRMVRAYTPWPLCRTSANGEELYILEGTPHAEITESSANGAPPGTVLGIDKGAGILIQTGDGVFAASRLQFRARKILDWKSFLNGAKHFIGLRLVRFV